MTVPRLQHAATHSSQGFIVVVVLWIVSALATLAVIYAIYVATSAGALSVGDDRLQADALVYAALELTAYELSGRTPRPAHGSFSFSAGRAHVTAQFRTESARIDLNKASKELIAGLFGVLGASPDDAKNYATNVVAWRTPSRSQNSNRNEASRYVEAGLNYAPRGGPFAHVGELWLVRGLPPELIARALPYVTVFSGMAEINAMEAAPEVLTALPSMNSDRLRDVMARRQTVSDSQAVIASFGPAQDNVTKDAGNASRIDVRIDFDNGRQVSVESVIAVTDTADTPYRVLSWQDGFDSPGPRP
jgi:general secretion pathway protein K